MFMVGVALPYSLSSRLNQGQSYLRIFAHTLYRSLVLVLLGVFLSSNGARQTDFTFVNVLTQIGLGYTLVFLLAGRGAAVQLAAIALILAGYWAAFALHPLPPPGFDYRTVLDPKMAGEDLQHFTAAFSRTGTRTPTSPPMLT
jgi:predicted acyltransferase